MRKGDRVPYVDQQLKVINVLRRLSGTQYWLNLLAELNTGHAVGIRETTSLPDHGRVSTWADTAEAGPSPSSLQECRVGRR